MLCLECCLVLSYRYYLSILCYLSELKCLFLTGSEHTSIFETVLSLLKKKKKHYKILHTICVPKSKKHLVPQCKIRAPEGALGKSSTIIQRKPTVRHPPMTKHLVTVG